MPNPSQTYSPSEKANTLGTMSFQHDDPLLAPTTWQYRSISLPIENSTTTTQHDGRNDRFRFIIDDSWIQNMTPQQQNGQESSHVNQHHDTDMHDNKDDHHNNDHHHDPYECDVDDNNDLNNDHHHDNNNEHDNNDDDSQQIDSYFEKQLNALDSNSSTSFQHRIQEHSSTNYNQRYKDQYLEPIVDGHNVRYVTIDNKQYLKLQILTWNMQGKPPPSLDILQHLVPSVIESQHIYVFGSQESCRSILQSFVFRSKQQWESALSQLLGPNYVAIASSTLVATHLIVFAHRQIAHLITHLATCEVATGALNQIGNKGCASASFRFANKSFLFMCSHLAAHQGNFKERNANYHKIISEVDYKMRGALGRKNSIFTDLDHVFFFGDLNYRINGNRQIVDFLLKNDKMEVLIANDQLHLAKKMGDAFVNFEEGRINFKPTYKLLQDANEYQNNEKKQRIPAWTDRILFFSKTTEKENIESSLKLLEYDAVFDVQYSDHRPVHARFLCEVNPHRQEVEYEEHVPPVIQQESETAAVPVVKDSSVVDTRFVREKRENVWISDKKIPRFEKEIEPLPLPRDEGEPTTFESSSTVCQIM